MSGPDSEKGGQVKEALFLETSLFPQALPYGIYLD